MSKDLANYQAEAVANGYTHDFGFDARSPLLMRYSAGDSSSVDPHNGPLSRSA